MNTEASFTITLNGERIRVERKGDAHTPVFYVHLPVEPVEVQLETDANGKEHWKQLPGGETEFAKKVGEAIENSQS
jgi:hypothetical protein